MALSTETVERVKRTKFGRAAALSRFEESGVWPEDVNYQLYRRCSELFDSLNWETNGVETTEEFATLFKHSAAKLSGCLTELTQRLETQPEN